MSSDNANAASPSPSDEVTQLRALVADLKEKFDSLLVNANAQAAFWLEMSRHFGPTETRLQAELRLFAFAQPDNMTSVAYTIAFKQLASSLDLPERCLRIFYLGNLNEKAQGFLNKLQSIPEKLVDLVAQSDWKRRRRRSLTRWMLRLTTNATP